MSGCYQCGFADGSESRLCETCHRERFQQELFVIQETTDGPVEGLEWSPRAQRLILSSGVLFYISLIVLTGYMFVNQPEMPLSVSADGKWEFYVAGDTVAPAIGYQQLADLREANHSFRR